MVQATSTWRYFVGVSEPVGATDDETEDDIEGVDTSSDWIELRNKGVAPVSLGGWGLSDDPDNPDKWTFPAGTSIPAGGYLVVLCDGLDQVSSGENSYHHTNFKISETGETIVLSDELGETIDSVSFGPQTAFESLGRDATEAWVHFGEPSPGAANGGEAFEGRVAPVEFGAAPGFHAGAVTVDLSTATAGATIRYTLDGTEPGPSNGFSGGSVVIGSSKALRARAFKAGMIASETTTGTYLINELPGRRAVPALCLVGD